MSFPIAPIIKLCNNQKEVSCEECPFWVTDVDTSIENPNCYFKVIPPYEWDVPYMSAQAKKLQQMWTGRWPRCTNLRIRNNRFSRKAPVGRGSGNTLCMD